MSIASGNFPELLWPGIHDLWGVDYKEYKALYPRIFTVKKSTMAFEKEQGVTGLPLASVKQQAGNVEYVDPYQGFQKEYINTTYGIGTTVTKEMVSDEKYEYINKLPKMLNRSAWQTKETLAFNHINRATTAGYTGADGVVLASASHPLVGGGTYSNIAATSADLSQTALEALTQQLMDAVDDRQLTIRVMPKCLLVPTASNFTARKLLESDGVVGTDDNDVNPLRGMFEDLIVSPYLTDTDMFGIVTDVDNGLVWYDNWKDQFERDNEFDTKSLKMTLVFRVSSGWSDPRGFYFNPGA